MNQPNEAIPLPPIGPPAPIVVPPPYQPVPGVQWPQQVDFPVAVPRDDLESLASEVIWRVLDHASLFDDAVATSFEGSADNEVWGSSAGEVDGWAVDLESCFDPSTWEVVDRAKFQVFVAALASALFHSDLLANVLSFHAYVDDQGFVVSHDEVRERLRAIVMGEEVPSRNGFVWQR